MDNIEHLKKRTEFFLVCLRSFPARSVVKNPMQKMKVPFLVLGDPMEKKMATYCGILAWEIPWTEEITGLQSMGMPKSWTPISD